MVYRQRQLVTVLWESSRRQLPPTSLHRRTAPLINFHYKQRVMNAISPVNKWRFPRGNRSIIVPPAVEARSSFKWDVTRVRWCNTFDEDTWYHLDMLRDFHGEIKGCRRGSDGGGKTPKKKLKKNFKKRCFTRMEWCNLKTWSLKNLCNTRTYKLEWKFTVYFKEHFISYFKNDCRCCECTWPNHFELGIKYRTRRFQVNSTPGIKDLYLIWDRAFPTYCCFSWYLSEHVTVDWTLRFWIERDHDLNVAGTQS